MKTLKDKVIAITGAGSGIGKALAKALGKKGAKLAINDYNVDDLQATTDELLSDGVQVSQHYFDVSDREAVYRFVDEVMEKHGQVDGVVNNAGVALGKISVNDVNWEQFEWIVNINLWGMIYGSKAFLPHLIMRPESFIVNISSIFGITGIPKQAPYCTTKFAIRGFTESLRIEMMIEHPHVNVLSVHPGGISTNIVNNSRWDGASEKDIKKLKKEFDKSAVTTPEQAAKQIIKGIKKRKGRVLIGNDASVIDKIVRWFPDTYPKLVLQYFKRLDERRKKKGRG